MAEGERAALQRVVAAIQPLDELEREHQQDVLNWLASEHPIYRTAKPATPPKHLVSYCVLVDPLRRSILLVDHRDAGLWLTTGGHVDVDENPANAASRELAEELGVRVPFLQGAVARPMFVTVAVTGGVSAGHTDVSLWYVFDGSEDDELAADPREFAGMRWWQIDEIVHGDETRFDPHLPRFVTKLGKHWAPSV